MDLMLIRSSQYLHEIIKRLVLLIARLIPMGRQAWSGHCRIQKYFRCQSSNRSRSKFDLVDMQIVDHQELEVALLLSLG